MHARDCVSLIRMRLPVKTVRTFISEMDGKREGAVSDSNTTAGYMRAELTGSGYSDGLSEDLRHAMDDAPPVVCRGQKAPACDPDLIVNILLSQIVPAITSWLTSRVSEDSTRRMGFSTPAAPRCRRLLMEKMPSGALHAAPKLLTDGGGREPLGQPTDG